MEYGLIGHPLGHSFSKEIHEALAGYTYEICDIDENAFPSFMEQREFKGINVTIPYKEKVIPYLDFIDPTAKKIGAVNTVVNKDGKLFGYNTDIFGLSELIKRNVKTLENKTVLVLGSGGTSKTAEYAADSLGCKKVYKASRKDGLLSPLEKTEYITYKKLCDIAESVDVIINTTPVGMYPESEKTPVDIEIFKNLEAVIDAVYNPLQTKLVCDAKKRGIKAESGLFMLVSQAVRASELFTEKSIADGKKEEVFKKILNGRQNTVLAGMPGCGKTTVGLEIAKLTGKKFIDTDSLIEKKYGHPSEIIKEHGEKYFRDIETETIAAVKLETGAVISVGGGAVLRDENVEYLKRNGVIVFLDREISDIVPTENRPLSSDREKLEKLYKERYGRYCAIADLTVKSTGYIKKTAKKIIGEVTK